jgi:lamin tail-like protein
VVTVRYVALATCLLSACRPQLGDVRINELSPANKIGCPDAFGDSVDWIELFNATSSVIDLGGYHVLNDATTPDLAVIPPGVTIPPRGYLVLWADDKQKGLDHLPFTLGGRDSVTVTDPNGIVVDECSWVAADPNISYARIPDAVGDFERCANPTCGASNGSSCD